MRWLLPALELALLIPLALGARYRHHREASWARWLSIALIAVANLANIYSLVLLAYFLVHGGKAGGHLSEMGISRLGNLSKILADPR